MTLPSAKRMYHIDLTRGECAKRIILVGDPARTERASKILEKVALHRAHREFVSYRGEYKGLEVTVLSTGIGPDNTEIALAEIFQIVKNPTIIRAGSCGSLQEDVHAGDLVISSAAMRLENTTLAYAPLGYPAVADYHVVLMLKAVCQKMRVPYHVGVTASAPGFYGAQGRIIDGLRPRDPNVLDHLRRLGVVNFEMEASVIFTLSQLAGARAGTICAVFADRVRDVFLSQRERRNAESLCVKAALEAIVLLGG